MSTPLLTDFEMAQPVVNTLVEWLENRQEQLRIEGDNQKETERESYIRKGKLGLIHELFRAMRPKEKPLARARRNTMGTDNRDPDDIG